MTSIALEREVYKAWHRRLGLKRDEYEKEALQSLVKSSSIHISSARLRSRLARSRIILFGDDLNVPQHHEKMFELLSKSALLRSETIFISNRFHFRDASVEVVRARLKKHRIRHLATNRKNLLQTLLREERRGRRVIIWTGALRTTPNHLPREIDKAGVNAQTVLLHAPDIRFASKDNGEWRALSDHIAAWVGLNSLLSLEYFRAWNERTSKLLNPDLLVETFRRYLSQLCGWLHQPAPPRPVRIFTAFDLQSFRPSTGPFLKARLKRGESAVLPRKKFVLLSSLAPGDVAEEAGHYIRQAGSKAASYDQYSVAVEEAFAFLASRMIDPDRKIPTPSGSKLAPWDLVHLAGYRVGAKLHRIWSDSSTGKKSIRALWTIRPKNWKEARVLWEEMMKLR